VNVKEQLDDIRSRITALETRPSWLDRIDYKWVIGTLLAFAAVDSKVVAVEIDAPAFGTVYGFTSAGGKSTPVSIAGTRSVGILTFEM